MRGEYKIRVKNNRNSYSFTLRRNITILRGDSGRGKTTLYEMIAEYNRYGKESGVFISSDRELLAVSGDNWQDTIVANPQKIIVIDEDSAFIRSDEFAKVVKRSDNYYLLITRNYLTNLPISVDEIYQLTGGKNNRFVKIYEDTDKMYNKPPKSYLPFKPDVIITEDSNSGYQFFNGIAQRIDVECISAEGKSNIFKKINEYKGKNVVAIADGAAFGTEMEAVVRCQSLQPQKIALYLPESFEWIDSKTYMSWEQYFTELLIKNSAKKEYMKYSKKKLKEYYLHENSIDAIKSIMNGIDFNK